MGWLGKIILGSVGLALRGPIGGLAGFLAGAVVDAAPGEFRRLFQATVASDEDVAYSALMGILAQCDGPMNDNELAAFRSFLESHGAPEESRETSEAVFRTAGNHQFSFEQLAVSYFRLCDYEDFKLHRTVEELLEMAASDGRINQVEERICLQAADIFLVNKETYARMRAKHGSGAHYEEDQGNRSRRPRPDSKLAACYETLGASPYDSDEEIKRKYRKLVSDFHPDKVASKELHEEFTRFANSRLSEINQAYGAIRESRGMS